MPPGFSFSDRSPGVKISPWSEAGIGVPYSFGLKDAI